MTHQNLDSTRVSGLPLKEPFFSVLVAVCAQMMRWFGTLHARFKNVGEAPVPHLVKLVAFLLCVPCFKCSNFFFERTFALNQRRLSLLGRQCKFLGGEDLSVQFEGLLVKDGGIAGLKCRAYRVLEGLDLGYHTANSGKGKGGY